LTISQNIPTEIVSEPAQLVSAVQAVGCFRSMAVDTESNSFHRYPEQLCLIQIATPERAYVIDTIAMAPRPLRDVLGNPAIMKIIHGADYDVRSLDRHYGFHIANLYDTSVAARFAGIARFGLADLIRELLGVTIEKSKRLQLTDWGRRPLSAEALDYAVTDVTYLLDLQGTLSKRIQRLGRTVWVAEECSRVEAVRYSEPDAETAFFSMKGAKDLDGRGLAVLRSLVTFREDEARRQRRPPFHIVPDFALVSLAGNPTARSQDIPGLGEAALYKYGRGILEAIRAGLAAAPVARPTSTFERPDREQVLRLKRLKAWRTSLGVSLALDPSLIWPAVSLERLAKAPATLDAEIASPDVRRWQREQFAASLRSYLKL
jgi:ribonuclease D